MKLLLINIYSPNTIARYLLSSYLLKAYLRKHYRGEEDLTIEVLNFSNKVSVEEICAKLLEENSNIIGYSCYVWNIEKILEVVKYLKDKTKEIIHIVGGPEISLNRILSLTDPSIADYYVIGEGEKKLLHLLHYLKEKTNGRKLVFPAGIAHWQNNKLNYWEDKETIKNLDEIPSIYLTGSIEDRLYVRQQAFMETQRGCRYRCKYCVYHKNLSSYFYYSLERIFDELDYLIVKKQITALRIFDAVFTSDLERAKKIVRHLLEIKNRDNLRLPWIYWEFRHNSIDEEFIKQVSLLKNKDRILNSSQIAPRDRPQHYSDMLKDYNAINCVGIQSFCNQALKAVGRSAVTKDECEYFMNTAKKNNIVLKLDLILGLPFETFTSYFDGLEFLLPYFKNTDHVLNIHRLQLLAGSELEQLSNKYEIEYSLQAPHLVYSTNSMPRQELDYAAKLTAVLFRIINSPLRQIFFQTKECSGLSFYNFIKSIYDRLISQDKFKSTRFAQNNFIDDDYWNGEVFSEIPSQCLVSLMESLSTQKVQAC